MKLAKLKNLTITVLLIAVSYYLFSGTAKENNDSSPIEKQKASLPREPLSAPSVRKIGEADADEAALPEDLKNSAKKIESFDPNELPDDLKAQLDAPPPELPEDLKKQLEMGTQELPEDLKAQLNAPPPPLPEDIQEALKVPPRVVSIDEVNGVQNPENE